MVRPWCQYWVKSKCLLNRTDSGMKCVDCMQELKNKILGAGDIVALTVNTTALNRLKWKGCKCGKRQKTLNRILPLVPKAFGVPELKNEVNVISRSSRKEEQPKSKPCGCRKKK